MTTDLNLTVPDATLDQVPALYADSFTIVRATTTTVSGVTTPGAAQEIGPFAGEFWTVRGDELAPAIAEARGAFRLACARALTHPTTGAAVTWRDSDKVRVGAVTYDVTWLPEPSGLDLTRIVGLKQ